MGLRSSTPWPDLAFLELLVAIDSTGSLSEASRRVGLSQPNASRTLGLRVSDGDGGTSAPNVLTINVTPNVDGTPLAYGEEAVNTFTAGSQDILAEVVCEDDEHLLEVVNRRVRAIPGVRQTETSVYLKLRKQIYTWGTR